MSTPTLPTFQGCTLLTSPRSPFGRRVRLAFREMGLLHEEKLLDVLKPNPEVYAKNPLGRVPTVILRSGEVLFESSLILEALNESHPNPLKPKAPADRLLCYRWSATALGLMEKTVEYFFESLRPEAHRDEELLREIRSIFEGSLSAFEQFLRTAPEHDRTTISGEGLTQADLDLGTALTYLSLRYPWNWRAEFPQAAAFNDRMESRASFRATVPPRPTN